MSESQVVALGAVTAMLIDVDRTINQLLAVKDGLLALGSQLSIEIGADAAAALSADGTGVNTMVDPGRDDAAAEPIPVSSSADAEAVELAGRAVAAEFAAALRVSDRTVQRRMSEAHTVVSMFPGVWRAQGAGRINAAHARAIIDAGAYLDDPAERDAYAAQMVEFAQSTSANRVARMARRVAERFQPRTIDARHQDARRGRHAWVADRADGMAMLGILGPAALIHGAYDRVTGLAQATAAERSAGIDGAGDDRCLDEIRCDIALDLLLTGTPAGHDPDGRLAGMQGAVSVTIPLSTLLGLGDTPAELNGRTPIDAATARRLAANAAGWDRIFTHPITGAVVAVDRYRPTAEQRRWLRARDQRCRFPGCGHPARECDIDHTADAATGGPTDIGNLGALCRRHHVVKHQTPWTVEQLGGGVFAWTSPTGHVYLDRPPPANATRISDAEAVPPF